MRGDGLKLCWESFRLDIRNNFFSESVMMHWHSCPEKWQSQSLEVIKKCVNVALTDID